MDSLPVGQSHNHRTVKHYALTDHKEYFAESTEAYLGVNDFFPFVRAELKQHDPRMFRLQEKIWGKIRWPIDLAPNFRLLILVLLFGQQDINLEHLQTYHFGLVIMN